MNKELLLRIVFGLLYILVIYFGTHMTGLSFGLLIGAFYLLCFFELNQIFNYQQGFLMLVSFAATSLSVYLLGQAFFKQEPFYFNLDLSTVLPVIAFCLPVITLFKFEKELNSDSGKIIFSALYLGIPFGLAFILPNLINYGEAITPEVFFLFVLLWASDTFAFVFGKLFGQTKLAPNISQGKTVEGFIGGFISVIVFGYFIEHYGPVLRGNWMVVAGIVSLAAPFGDLVESKIKRRFNVKDSGRLLPGHGGYLDRLDTFIFVVPFVFFYFLFLGR